MNGRFNTEVDRGQTSHYTGWEASRRGDISVQQRVLFRYRGRGLIADDPEQTQDTQNANEIEMEKRRSTRAFDNCTGTYV